MNIARNRDLRKKNFCFLQKLDEMILKIYINHSDGIIKLRFVFAVGLGRLLTASLMLCRLLFSFDLAGNAIYS